VISHLFKKARPYIAGGKKERRGISDRASIYSVLKGDGRKEGGRSLTAELPSGKKGGKA